MPSFLSRKALNLLFSVLLIAAYPILVHASFLFAMPKLQVAALAVFLVGVFWLALWRGKIMPWLLLALLLAGVFALGYFSLTLYVLYVTPVVIPFALLIFFGRTLLPNRTPLISEISSAARGPLTPALQKYTRRLTQMWTFVFLLLTLSAAILPWLQQPQLWSWLTNIINYGLVGLLFAGEFMLRKRLFPEHDHPSFIEYIGIIAKANIFKSQLRGSQSSAVDS